MSTSYKFGLAAASLICALAVGYYLLADRSPQPADPAPEPEPAPEIVEPDPVAPPPDEPDDRLAEPSPPETLTPAQTELPSETEAPTEPPEALSEDADEPTADQLAEAVAEESVPSLTIGPDAGDVEEAPEAVDAPGPALDVDEPDDPVAEAQADFVEGDRDPTDAPEADTEAELTDEAQADAEPTDGRRVPATYTIRRGDTFSGIAERFYGHERHWHAIAEHNPGVDPNRIRVGQEIDLPDPADLGIEPIPDDGTVLYTVRARDTLASIAQEHYGSRDAWRDIYDANRERIGDDPDRIREGMELRIPPATQQTEAQAE